jgi:hypothetical protein
MIMGVILHFKYIQYNMDKFIIQLETFLVENKVMGYTAGYCIALVTKDLIHSLISDLFIPIVIFFISFTKIKIILNILPKSNGLNIIEFIKQLVTWVIMIVVTILVIKYFLKSIKTNDISNNIIRYAE